MADASQSPQLNPSDLETPTLKKPIVTTGRGGTGNMAKNTNPTETRLRQDVEAYANPISFFLPIITRSLSPDQAALALPI